MWRHERQGGEVEGGLGLAMSGEHDAPKQLEILNKRVMEGFALRSNK